MYIYSWKKTKFVLTHFGDANYQNYIFFGHTWCSTWQWSDLPMIKNSYQDGLGRTTQTLDHVVVVHILIWDKRKSQTNKCSVLSVQIELTNLRWLMWFYLEERILLLLFYFDFP